MYNKYGPENMCMSNVRGHTKNVKPLTLGYEKITNVPHLRDEKRKQIEFITLLITSLVLTFTTGV